MLKFFKVLSESARAAIRIELRRGWDGGCRGQSHERCKSYGSLSSGSPTDDEESRNSPRRGPTWRSGFQRPSSAARIDRPEPRETGGHKTRRGGAKRTQSAPMKHRSRNAKGIVINTEIDSLPDELECRINYATVSGDEGGNRIFHATINKCKEKKK